MSKIEVDAIEPQSGTSLTLGASGDTITIPSGATLTNSGTATGFGKVLQVVQAEYSTATTQTASSYATSGLSASITPSSASNKILITTSSSVRTFGDGSDSSGRNALAGIFRGTVADTKLQEQYIGLSDRSASTSVGTQSMMNVAFNYLDSPSTTSAQTYTVGISGAGSTDITAQYESSKSTITLMEIAG
jgi:hypothetical protein